MADEEAVEEYRSSLGDLKMNSKPLINMLTMLAEENKQYADQFVKVIEDRALQAPQSEKLPTMYLIDSIMKNLTDSNYLQLFSKNIVSTFVAVFEKVDEKTRTALYKLRQTWNDLFPNRVLYALDLRVSKVDPAWPVTATLPEVPSVKPATTIHVNPKFLTQHSQQMGDVPVLRPHVVIEDVERIDSDEKKRLDDIEMTAKLENDVTLRQQLMAKQQEILRLHQQELELKIARANALIDQQAKLFQKNSIKEAQAKESVKPTKALAVAKPTIQTASAKIASVPVVTRDPRIRPSADPRVSRVVSTSLQQTAVVLPTPSSKSFAEIAATVQDSAASAQSVAKVMPNLAGNIFDRLQDLTVKSEPGSPAKAASPAKEIRQSGVTKGTNGQKSSPDKKPGKKSPAASPAKVSQTSTKVSPPEKKTNKEVGRKSESRSPRKSGSPRAKSPSEDRTGRDPYVRQRRPSKSTRNRSPGSSSDAPPVKSAKRSDQIQRGSNFKQGPPMNRRQRQNSVREDGFSGRSRQQGNERHPGNNRKRTLAPDPVLLSPTDAKKSKRVSDVDLQGTNQLSDDLMELFGREDKDYRCIATMAPYPESSGFKELSMAAPPRRRDSLLLSPPLPPSSQSSGWAQFKASRPEDFPFQLSQPRSLRESLDTDIRSALLVSPGLKPSFNRRAPLLPTPQIDLETTASGLPANSTLLPEPVTMDALQRQVSELQRLKEMKKHLDEQRERLMGNPLAPAVAGPAGPGDELHRLQTLKRDLDEKHERIQMMIDSGLRISDEFTSAFPTFGDTPQEAPHQVLPAVRNKRLDVHDESSRSPVYQERSLMDHGYYPRERGGLLGDRPSQVVDPRPSQVDPRPSQADPRLERRADEVKVLLPTPKFLDMDGGKSGVALSMPPPPYHGLPQEMEPICEDEKFYYPECDPRWSMRAQSSRSLNVYNVVINGRHYEMMFTNRPLKIWLNRQETVIRLDPETRQLWCNDVSIYHIGEEERSVILNGNPHLVFVQGPARKLWIDGQLFDISVDSPPEKINIGGREHKISIDGRTNRIIVDGFDICPYGTDEEQHVKLAFVEHTIRFQPPCKTILIDGNECELNLSGKYPVVIINGKPHGIRFDGPPRMIFVDDKPWTIPIDNPKRCHLDGPSSKPALLAFGGPSHEIIVDDQWYEIKFDGAPKFVKVGRKMRKFQLKGKTPEVKILDETVLMKQETVVDAPTGMLTSDGFQRPASQVGFNLKPIHLGASADAPLRHAATTDNIPSLLDISVGPKIERNRSFGQFPPPRQQENFPPPSGGFDKHMQGPGHIEGMVGPHGPRPLERSFGSGPFDSHQNHGRGQRFGGPLDGCPRPMTMDQRPRLPQQHEHNEFMPPQMQSVPFGMQGPPPPLHPQQGMMQLRPLEGAFLNQAGPRFGPHGPGMPPQSDQHFNQFSYREQQPQMHQPWNQAEQFGAPPNNIQVSAEGGSSTAPQPPPQVDVNTLLTQLLAAGLIKKASENEAVAPSTSDVSQPIAVKEERPAVLDRRPSEEQKEEAKKEELLVEDVPDLADFNLDNLKKRYPGAMQRVYLGIQCPSCGVRFSTEAMDKYTEHLDWHFRKNRREKEEMRVAKFRRWYYDVVDWIQFEEVASSEDQSVPIDLVDDSDPSTVAKSSKVLESQASNITSCPQASINDKEDICDTCRESFEQFWDEEREAWHLKDAIRVDEKTYHPICYEDVKDLSGTDTMETEVEIIAAAETPATSDALEQPQETRMEEEATTTTTTTTTVPTVEQMNLDIMLENVENDRAEVSPSSEVMPPHLINTETQVTTENLPVAENQLNSTEDNTKIQSRPSSPEQSLQVEGDGTLGVSSQESKNFTDSDHQKTVATECSERGDSNSFNENKNN